MGITYIGSQVFVEQHVPIKGKTTDFGVDTMRRTFRGKCSLLPTFLNSLRQGQDYQGYALQTWEVDDGQQYSTVTLNYKGLSAGTLPPPMVTDSTSIQSVSFNQNTPLQVSGTLQMYVEQTTWRYIWRGAPSGPTYTSTLQGRDPTIVNKELRDSGGNIYLGLTAAEILALITAIPIIDLLMSHNINQVYGTPFYECEDVVIRTYQSS